MAKREPFELGGEEIAAGERRSIELALPTLYSQAPIYMPVHVIHGKRPGPILFVSGAVHGDEINGVEIIRRLLKHRSLKSLKGTLVAVPIVNVYGFVNVSRYLPDRRDLNRSFPGSEQGSMASRLAHTFMTSIVEKCTHGIDLHTGAISRENLPQIRALVADNPVVEDMALAFGAPVILNAEIRDGSLRAVASDMGIPVLLYEAGEALRFDEFSIRAGVKGVVNVMRHLGMLAKKQQKSSRKTPFIALSSKWVRAQASGILRVVVPTGAHIQEGQVIGYISNPFGTQDLEVKSNSAGIVIGRTVLPLVHEGEALFHIGLFKRMNAVAQSLENFQDEHDPILDNPNHLEPPLV